MPKEFQKEYQKNIPMDFRRNFSRNIWRNPQRNVWRTSHKMPNCLWNYLRSPGTRWNPGTTLESSWNPWLTTGTGTGKAPGMILKHSWGLKHTLNCLKPPQAHWNTLGTPLKPIETLWDNIWSLPATETPLKLNKSGS